MNLIDSPVYFISVMPCRILKPMNPWAISWTISNLMDLPLMKTDLEKSLEGKDLPCLRLETDYGMEDVEQVKIRVEALIEQFGE